MTYPTIFQCLTPALTVFADTNNYVESVVTSVEALTMTLRAIPDEGESIVLKVLLKFRKRPVGTFVDGFLRPRKIQRLDTAR